ARERGEWALCDSRCEALLTVCRLRQRADHTCKQVCVRLEGKPVARCTVYSFDVSNPSPVVRLHQMIGTLVWIAPDRVAHNLAEVFERIHVS
ncbi:MAG: hypothetical protein ABSH50_24950, partial [Bryobacteraceae bacterium]